MGNEFLPMTHDNGLTICSKAQFQPKEGFDESLSQLRGYVRYELWHDLTSDAREGRIKAPWLVLVLTFTIFEIL